MKITLDWPSKDLSPNATGLHWGTKGEAAKKAKSDGYYSAKRFPIPKFPEGNIPMSIIFFPPDKCHRDLDNMLASLKHPIDGICLAFGINDKRLRPITLDVGEVRKGGAVEVEI